MISQLFLVNKHLVVQGCKILILQTMLVFCLVGFLTTNARADSSTSEVAPSYVVERAIIPGQDINQFGLMYRNPHTIKPQPGIIVLHGWATAGTIGAALVAELAFEFQQAGFSTLALSLRGWPETGGKDGCAAQQPQDVVTAARWFGQQPHVDAQRMALVGHSQGGQVALLAGTLDSPVQAIVAYAPVTELEAWRGTSKLPGIIDYVSTTCSGEPGIKARSPLHVAARIHPPVLLIHGSQDSRVPLQQSQWLEKAMNRAGRDVELKVVPGAGHHWSELGNAEIALDFLQGVLQ